MGGADSYLQRSPAAGSGSTRGSAGGGQTADRLRRRSHPSARWHVHAAGHPELTGPRLAGALASPEGFKGDGEAAAAGFWLLGVLDPAHPLLAVAVGEVV